LLWPERFLPEQLAWGVSETSKISSISTNAAGFCVKKPWNIQTLFIILYSFLIKNKPGPVQDAHGAGLCL
jgi:hypothetical protein